MNGKGQYFCLGEIKIGSSNGYLLDNVVSKGSQLKGQSRRTYMRGLLEAGEALSLMGLDMVAKSIFEQNYDFYMEDPQAAKRAMQVQLLTLISARLGQVNLTPVAIPVPNSIPAPISLAPSQQSPAPKIETQTKPHQPAKVQMNPDHKEKSQLSGLMKIR